MATSIYLESFTAIKSANLVHASLNKVEVCTTQLQFKENQRFQHNCKNANAINIYKTMLRLLLGLALLCIYNGEQVTASPLTKAPDAPQSKILQLISSLARKNVLQSSHLNQTHWKVLISLKEIWLSQLSSLKNIMAHKTNM